jgi:hypothetical protein
MRIWLLLLGHLCHCFFLLDLGFCASNLTLNWDFASSVEEKDKEEVQPKPTSGSSTGGGDVAKPVCYETSRRSDTCEATGDVRVYVDSLDHRRPPSASHGTRWPSGRGQIWPRIKEERRQRGQIRPRQRA